MAKSNQRTVLKFAFRPCIFTSIHWSMDLLQLRICVCEVGVHSHVQSRPRSFQPFPLLYGDCWRKFSVCLARSTVLDCCDLMCASGLGQRDNELAHYDHAEQTCPPSQHLPTKLNARLKWYAFIPRLIAQNVQWHMSHTPWVLLRCTLCLIMKALPLCWYQKISPISSSLEDT